MNRSCARWSSHSDELLLLLPRLLLGRWLLVAEAYAGGLQASMGFVEPWIGVQVALVGALPGARTGAAFA